MLLGYRAGGHHVARDRIGRSSDPRAVTAPGRRLQRSCPPRAALRCPVGHWGHLAFRKTPAGENVICLDPRHVDLMVATPARKTTRVTFGALCSPPRCACRWCTCCRRSARFPPTQVATCSFVTCRCKGSSAALAAVPPGTRRLPARQDSVLRAVGVRQRGLPQLCAGDPQGHFHPGEQIIAAGGGMRGDCRGLPFVTGMGPVRNEPSELGSQAQNALSHYS